MLRVVLMALQPGITNISIIPYYQPLCIVCETHTTSAEIYETIVAKPNKNQVRSL